MHSRDQARTRSIQSRRDWIERYPGRYEVAGGSRQTKDETGLGPARGENACVAAITSIGIKRIRKGTRLRGGATQEGAPPRTMAAADAQQARAAGVPWRALVVGTVLLPLLTHFGHLSYIIAQSAVWTAETLLRGPVVLLFLLVVLVAGVAADLARGWRATWR